ncbi:MAG TPA: AMP-binding protein, partial [Afifellaceae bacterium]|nr:AMP-binding protein [Afifellaceae bacterium]
EGWLDVPVLTRSEAHDNEDALHAETVPPEMRPLQDDRTSGTTGTPLLIRRTALARVAAKAMLGRALSWHGRADVGTVAVTSTGGLYRDAAGSPGATLMIPVEAALDEQLALLRQAMPTHIVGYPNQVLNWLESGERRAFRNVRCVIATGEVLQPETKQRIVSALGCVVVDIYSTTETGPVALAGKSGGFRVAEENVYLDADDAGGKLQPVTVTPFYGFGTPLIRYRPGDYLEHLRPGRGSSPGLRRFLRVVGRERNLLVRRDGSRFWPNITARLMTKVLDYGDWQVVQDEPGKAVMSIVMTPDTPRAKLDELRTLLLRDVFGDFDLEIQPVDRLETGLGAGKTFQSVISHVRADR